jgi:osmotically-inducible protein OsmY
MNCDLASASAASAKTRDHAQELMSVVSDALFAARNVDLAFVDFGVSGDCVVLYGSVPSYRLKQLAQVVVMRVAGVGRVENRLVVRPVDEWVDDARDPWL